MLKAYKRLLPYVIGVGLLLIVAYSCRYVSPEFVDESAYRVLLSTILTTVRNIIHLALLLSWCISIRRRIVDNQIRHHLLCVGILMVSWVFLRAVKFEFTMTNEDILGRYIWYYFYVPMILIPLLGVYIVHLIGKPDGYKLPRKFYFLLAPAFTLLLLIFTNDFHQLAFEFPKGINLYDSDYEYGIVFFITFAWFSLLGLYFVIMLLKKSRVPGSKAFKSLPLVIMLGSIVFWIFYGMGIIKGDLTTIDCLIITLLLESAVQSGLIPSNSSYNEIFNATTVPVMIVDEDYTTCYSSATVTDVSVKEIKNAEGGFLNLGDTVLHSKEIKGGRVLWQDDVATLNKLKDQLQETISHLGEENELLKAENEVKENRAKADEKNRLYDRIAKEVEPRLNFISAILKNVKNNGMDSRAAMAQICVVGSYIKRRGNLLLLGEENEKIPSKELEFCFFESMDNLKLCGALTSLDCCCECDISLENAVKVYDLYENIVEKLMAEISALLIRLYCENESINLRMQIGCNEGVAESVFKALSLISDNLNFEISDDDLIIEYSLSAGGEDNA